MRAERKRSKSKSPEKEEKDVKQEVNSKLMNLTPKVAEIKDPSKSY